MPAESGVTWLGGGPKMKVHWDRLKWNLVNIFNFRKHNPYHETKERLAITDLHHAITNIPTEFCRAAPFRAGHVMLVQTILILVLSVVIGCGYYFY